MPDNFICGKCGKVAKTKQALERHAAYHEDDRPFSCEVCLQRFKNSDDRGKHYRRLKRDGKFTIACTVCHKHFKTEEILQKHIEMLGCNVAVIDVIKDQNATESVDTNNEGNTIHLKEEFVPGDRVSCTCKICETEFFGANSLKKHYKEVHNDKKRQVCIQCGQTLSSKDSLARHFSIFHQSSFPYSCEICNQKFKIKEALCRHVKFVHQDGGYQCPECHRVFSQPVNLRKHLAVHSNHKEFACKACGREFKWKQALQKHELLHGIHSSSSKTKTGDNTSKRNDTDHCTVENAGNSDDDDGYGDDDQNVVDEAESCNDMEISFVQAEKAPEKQCSDKEIESNIFHTSSANKTQNKYKRSSATCSPSEGFNVRNESSISSRLGNSLAKKKGDEYDFPDEDCDFKHSTSNKTNDFVCRKRTGSFADTHYHDNKKFKEANDHLSRKKERSLSSEEVKSNVKLHVSIKDNELDKKVSKTFPHHENLDDDSNKLPENRNDSDHEAEYNEDFRKGMSISRPMNRCESESAQCDKNTESDTGLQKLTYSALTSFPTEKTKDAPKLIFKPSSIKNIMDGPEVQSVNTRNSSDEKSDDESVNNSRKPVFRLPASFGSLYTKLHNPFIIPNRSQRNPVPTDNPTAKDVKDNRKDKLVTKCVQEAIKPVAVLREQIIPSGKFSLVKHMLSLQNEENFDKTIFENPLYNKPAEIKDFERMIERHRVTDQSDDSTVHSYDLSAKQNIPFHWLGMSFAKQKKSIADDCDKELRAINDSENLSTEHEEEQNNVITETSLASSGTDTSQECSEETTGNENMDTSKNVIRTDTAGYKGITGTSASDQIHRGFQAIKKLVAGRQLTHKNDSQFQASGVKSVLTNPFDFENEYFQDKAKDLSRTKHEVSTLRKSVDTSAVQIEVHSAEKFEGVTKTAEEKEHMFNLNRAADLDIFHNHENSSKHVSYSRHHLDNAYSQSSSGLPFYSNSKYNLHLHRAHSGSSVAPGIFSNTTHVSRSVSIPCSSERFSHMQPQKMWTSDSPIQTEDRPDKTLKELQTYNSSVDLTQSLPYGPSDDCLNEVALNRERFLMSRDDRKESVTERQPDITPHREIDLMMISKNFAQLQKLNHGKFDKGDLRTIFRHCNIRENMNRHELEHDWMNINEPLPQLSERPACHKLTSSYVPVHQKVTNDVNAGLGENTVFDAYHLINSPRRTNVHQLPETLNHSQDFEGFSVLGSVQQGHCNSLPVEKSRVDESNGKDDKTTILERRNINVFEKERIGQDVERRCMSQHDSGKKTEVSIFDILKGQGGKGKDFDNIESLISSYT